VHAKKYAGSIKSRFPDNTLSPLHGAGVRVYPQPALRK